MNTKKIFFFTLVCASLAAAYFLLRQPSPNNPSNTLTVGMFVWAPFMSINEKGEYEGFDVDVAQELAARMKKKLIIKDLGSLAPLLLALQQNKIDLLLSDLDITQKRLEIMTMINYTGSTVRSFFLVFWKQIPQGITSLKDLAQLPKVQVCAEPGSAQERFLDAFPQIAKKPLSSLSEIVLDLKFGKSTAALLEPKIARRVQQQNPETRLLEIPLPPDFQVYGCGIGINKKNRSLSFQIETIIAQMRADGTLARLEQKWNLGE